MKPSRTVMHWIDALPDHGESPALLAFTRQGVDTWSYGDLDGRIRQAQEGLHRSGLEPGDRVALFAPNSPKWIAACLAVIRSGAIAVPLDVQLADEVLRGVLDDCDPRLVLTTSDRIERLGKLELKSDPQLDALEDGKLFSAEGSEKDEGSEKAKEKDSAAIEPDSEAVLFYTSGTTGPPKGVPLTHGNVAFELNSLLEADLVGPSDRALLPLPLHHVYPFVVGMLTPIALGLPIVLPHSLTGPQLARAVREGEVTVIIGVPRLYRALVDGVQAKARSKGRMASAIFRALLGTSEVLRRRLHLRLGKQMLRPLHQQFGSQLRMMASGGSPLDPDLAWKLEAMGWQVAIGYGLTETSPLITLNRPERLRVESVGEVIPEVEVRLDPSADPQRKSEEGEGSERSGEPSESDAESDAESDGRNGNGRGEILVRGPNVFRGYRNLPDKTKEAFTDDGWFRTGDLGSIDDEGWVYVHGRASTMIVTEGGENVQPDEVEEAYADHPAIRELGVLKKNGGLAALIVPEARESDGNGEKGMEEAIRKAVEERGRQLPSYQRLADFALTRDSLPRTRLGKIQRHQIQERFEKAKEEGLQAEETGPIPIEEMSGDDRSLLDDPAAREAWELLASKYSDRRLTPDTSPQLDLGIDSMGWLDLSLELSQRAGVELDEEAMGRVETVRELLQEVIEGAGSDGGLSLDEILEQPLDHLSDTQKQHLKPHGRITAAVARSMFSTSRFLMRTAFRFEARGRDRLPEPPFILAPNHASALDAPAVAAAVDNDTLQRTYWGGWTGIMFSNPLVRGLSRLAHVVPVDFERSARSSLAFGSAALDEKRNLVWFPEGSRSPDGKLLPFKPGIGLLLERHRVPVVPVFIAGAHEALPLGHTIPRLRKITLTFGRPLQPDELEQQGEGEKAHERIVDGLRQEIVRLAEAHEGARTAAHV